MSRSQQVRRVVVLGVCATVWHWGGRNFAFGRPPKADPTPSPILVDAEALEADVGTGGAAAVGIPLCETTGFEANEPTCNWEADYGICGSTFTCKNTATDGPYPTTCNPPLTQPDNCCVDAPNPNTGWYLSVDSQHCQVPRITTTHPASGSQHLRFERSGCWQSGGCPNIVFTPDANPDAENPFPPGVTITSFDVSCDGPPNDFRLDLEWTNQSLFESRVAQRIVFFYGNVATFDYGLDRYIHLGYLGTAYYGNGGDYHHVETIHDVCNDSISYYFDGVLMHQTKWRGGTEVRSIEQNVWVGHNTSGLFYDVDNFSVSRYFPPDCDPIEGGACCDRLTGICTDELEAAACADPYDVYSDNELCSMVECEVLTGACCNHAPGSAGACAITTLEDCPTLAHQSWTVKATCDGCKEIAGACCNAAPGAGGACDETTMADCPASEYQSWTVEATCGDITCEEVTGSCCKTLTGVCAAGALQGQCQGTDLVWSEGGTCGACVARTGACCVHPSVTEAVCTDGQTVAQCSVAGGVWSDGEPCSAVECTPEFTPIPAVSEWGLLVLGLVLMIVGKVYAKRTQQC